MKKNNYLLSVAVLILVLALIQCASIKSSKSTASSDTNLPRVDFKRALKKLSTPWSVQRVSPVVSDDFIFQATGTGVTSFSKNGRKLWTFKVAGGVEGTPLYYQKNIFFGANDGYFYCLGAQKGTLLWKKPVDHSVMAQPVAWKNNVYFVTSGNELYALNVRNGAWMWHYKREAQTGRVTIRGSAALTLYGESLYAGFADGYIVHLKAASGAVSWTKKIGSGRRFADIMSIPYVDKKQVLVLDYEGELHSLDKTGGGIVWKSSLGGIRFFTVRDNHICVTTAANEIALLKYDKGAVIWKKRIEGGSLTAPVVLDNLVYVGDSGSRLHVLSANDGHEVWSFREKYGFTAAPTVFGKKVYIHSNSSRLIVFR